MRKKTAKTKSSFTLLEIFICLLILGIAAGVVFWQIKGLMDRHKLYSTAHRVVSQLRELQSLAMSYQRDMELEIIQKKEGLAFIQRSDEPIKSLQRKEIALKDGCDFTFNKASSEKLKFTIYSTGRIEPLGMLEIKRKESSLFIDLSRPLLITLSDKN